MKTPARSAWAAGRGAATRPDAATDDRDVAAFLERFFRFGAEPSVETYMPLFHPDVALFDDGMERPVGHAEIPASIDATLALAQGFRIVPERWRARDGTPSRAASARDHAEALRECQRRVDVAGISA